jgi:hypothetical protein
MNKPSENEKDFQAGAFYRIYGALCCAGQTREEQEAVTNWLNRSGFSTLTVCPFCHVDDFVHTEGCELGILIEKARSMIRDRRDIWIKEVLREVARERIRRNS